MAIKGHLSEMSLPTLVQMTCQEGNPTRLSIQQDDAEAVLYFDGGNIVHATLEDLTGEEVIYTALAWQDGDFELEAGVSPPERTITASWSSLLLEGLHRIDEGAAGWDGLDELEADVDVEEPPIEPKEVSEMATRRRSDVLNEQLEALITESGDINGAVIVGIDGLVLASNLTVGGHDATRVGAEGAALMGLSKRALETLKCGDFQGAILQGHDGWVIAMAGGSRAIVVGLTNANVNLGMAMIEMRDIAADVAETLD